MKVTSVTEFTRKVLHRCGEFELHALAYSTVYANKRNIEKWYTSWEAAWRKKCRNSLSRSKVLPCESSPTRNGRKQQTVNQCVEIAEADVLGAALDEPLDVYNVAALRWWLHAVSWNQACTFVEKATIDFKVGFFSIVHIKAISMPPSYFHKQCVHSQAYM